jgi:hypothetical protein
MRVGVKMATKSILKDIVIRDEKLAKKLIIALENAEKKSRIDVKFSKPVNNVCGETIKKMFSEDVY